MEKIRPDNTKWTAALFQYAVTGTVALAVEAKHGSNVHIHSHLSPAAAKEQGNFMIDSQKGELFADWARITHDPFG